MPKLSLCLSLGLRLCLPLTVCLWLAACSPSAQHQAASESERTQQANSELHKNKHAASTSATQAPMTILALGDSLTEGLGVARQDNYPAQLQHALKQAGYDHVKVVNAGLSGETSIGLVGRIDWALKTKPDITILTIGANDAMRGIAVDTIENNIRTAIVRLQEAGSSVVLGGMQIYDNMGDDYVQAFASMYQRIAQDTGVAFIPFFLEGVAGDIQLNQADRIHPNAKGYTHIVEQNLLPVLKPMIQDALTAKASGNQQ